MNPKKNAYRLSRHQNKIILLFLLLIGTLACAGPLQPRQSSIPFPTSPTTVPTPIDLIEPSSSAVQTSTIAVIPSIPSSTNTPPVNALECSATHPLTTKILQEATASSWLGWVKKLSGAEPVTVGGRQVTFATRYTPTMFSTPGPNALDFIHETVAGWYPKEQIAIQSFTTTINNQNIQGKNLILTIPGTVKKEEVVILSAHLDSISQEAPDKVAPGAEDNASGSAALIEAARLFRDHQFERTVRIIWFTGEEQGMLGSKAYVKQEKNLREIKAVINLDMFGYDSDNDHCFEIHVGTLPESDRIGQCFLRSIESYDLELPHPDYLTNNATGSSDHGSFWSVNVGAIEILENMFGQDLANGCPNADKNSNYHTTQDTYDRLNPDSAIRIVRASLATLLAYAGPIQ